MNVCLAVAIALSCAAVKPKPVVLAQSAYKCGFKPIPPPRCSVGECVCDAADNCSWQIVCR